MNVLKTRADFMRLSSLKQSWITPGFILQGARQEPQTDQTDELSFRIGFTASKKVGNAVKRNFAKRRLRALAHQILTGCALKGYDYVLVARPEVLLRPFKELEKDLEKAVRLLHKKYDFK